MIDRATRILISQMGAEILIAKQEYQHTTAIHRQVLRNRSDRQITALDGTPYIYPSDGMASTVTILWPSYYKPAHEAQAIMRRALGAHHIGRDEMSHVWAVPHALGEPPLPGALSVWRRNTMKGIEAADSEHVILVGSQAVSMWNKDAKIKRYAGNAYVWGRHYVYPMYNPLALHHDLRVEDWEAGFKKLAWSLREGSVLSMLDTACHQPACDREGVVYDQRAVAWCNTHFKISRATKQEREWTVKSNKLDQQTLV